MNLTLIRDMFAPDFTLGTLSESGVFLGYTCEDTDRRMEDGGQKVHGSTAIPRGRYKCVLSKSTRFKRIMPEVQNVPGFSGVRIHGGNTHKDTEGCPLLGLERTANGVRNCAAPNAELIRLMEASAQRGEEVWLAVE